LKIITSCNDPVFPRNKSTCPHRDICDIECPQQQLCIVVVDVDLAIVQGTQDPGFNRVKIDRLHAIGPAGQEFLDLCPLDLQRHPRQQLKHRMGLGILTISFKLLQEIPSKRYVVKGSDRCDGRVTTSSCAPLVSIETRQFAAALEFVILNIWISELGLYMHYKA